jgi:hypothetical protein
MKATRIYSGFFGEGLLVPMGDIAEKRESQTGRRLGEREGCHDRQIYEEENEGTWSL